VSVAATEEDWACSADDGIVVEQTAVRDATSESASTASGYPTPALGMSPVSSVEDVAGLCPPPASTPLSVPLGTPLSQPLFHACSLAHSREALRLGTQWDAEEPGAVRTALAHSRVPKPKNLKELYGATQSGFTTIMVRNLPNRYKQRDFVEELTLLGLPAGTWDFLYVPVDTHTNSSVGYAFVNFVSTEIAQHAMQIFDQYRWRRFRKQTSKPAAVNKAHIQGLANNLDHFSRTAIKDAKVKQHRPLVLAGAHELPSWAAAVDSEWNPEQCFFVGVAAF